MPPWHENEPWIVVEHRRRRGTDRGWPDGRIPSPRRGDRTAYASVTGRERGGGERDFFHPRQPKWSGEPRFVDRYAAHQRKRPDRDRITDRESTQHKRYVNSSRTDRAEPRQKKIQSDDPDFSAKVRIIYKLIKTVHHLKNVSGAAPPPSLNKIAHNLMTVIKPAIPNSETQTLIEANAKNWAHTATLILRDHYNERNEEAVKTLFEFPEQDWRGPFEIAASWAKRNLGRRLLPESLQQTEAIIAAKLADVQVTAGSMEQNNTISEPDHQPQVNGEAAAGSTTAIGEPEQQLQVNEGVMQFDIVQTLDGGLEPTSLHTRPATAQTKTDRITPIIAQLHAAPAPITTLKKTTSTMTDPVPENCTSFMGRKEGRNSTRGPAITPETAQEPKPIREAHKDQRVDGILTTAHEISTGEKSSPSIQWSQAPNEETVKVNEPTLGESTPKETKRGRLIADNIIPMQKLQLKPHLGPPHTNVERLLNSCVPELREIMAAWHPHILSVTADNILNSGKTKKTHNCT